MRQNMFKTTTALITSVSLMLPAQGFAQTADTEGLLCLDGTEIPCLPGQEPLDANGLVIDGTTMTKKQIAKRKEEMKADKKAAKAEEAAKAAEDAAEDAAAAEAQAADDAAALKAAEDAAAAQAAAEAKAAEDAAALKAAEDAAAAQAEAEAKAAEDAAALKAAEEAAAAQAEQDAADLAKAEKKARADAEKAEARAAEDAAALEKAIADREAEQLAAEAEAAAAAATAEPANEEILVEELTEILGVDASGEVAEVEVPELPVQPDAATGAAPVAEAASLPLIEVTGGDAQVAADATVSEEVVTADRIRRSDQDFANKVNVTAAEAVAEKVRKKKDKKPGGKPEVETELSDLEKVLLLGLGAVAVGSMLSNNREVELNSGDRVVVKRDDGSYQVIKDDDTLLRQPGSTVRTETFADGSTRTTVSREDGTKIVTIRDAEYRVLRRILVDRDGRQTVLIDDTVEYEPVVISQLPPPPQQQVIEDPEDELALRLALERAAGVGRTFSLAQVRDIAEVRALVPVIDLDAITFDSGSAAIKPEQARALATLGRIIAGYIEENPREVFLIEGHTDAVGGAAYNLALSDRRAESVALALTEYFAIPPENLVVQGYGEEFLKVNTLADERANRRASVRRITDLLRMAAAN